MEEASKFVDMIRKCPNCKDEGSPASVEPVGNNRWMCHECNSVWRGEDYKDKPEMIRRAKLVKWVRSQHEAFEMMYGRTSPDYAEGIAYVLNKLCENFDIDGIDLQE